MQTLHRLAVTSSILLLPAVSLAEPAWLPPPALIWPADGDEAVPASPLFVRSVDVVEIEGPSGRFVVPYSGLGEEGDLYVPEEPLSIGTWTVHGMPSVTLANEEAWGTMLELGSFTVVEGSPPTEPPHAVALRGHWLEIDGSFDVQLEDGAAGEPRRYELDIAPAVDALDGAPDGESDWTVSATVNLHRSRTLAFDLDDAVARVRPIDAFGLVGEWTEPVEIDFKAAEQEQRLSCRAAPGATGGGASLVVAWLAFALVTLRTCRGRRRSCTR